MSYCGRFAPSPTGPLHFGSLIAAVGSYLQARRQGGRWLLRIDDLDTPRTQAGAAASILQALQVYGMRWDEPLIYQSTQTAAYHQALERLAAHVYPCGCSRQDIANAGGSGGPNPPYPGTCRAGLAPGKTARSVRVRTDQRLIQFEDAVQGPQAQCLAEVSGDFVLRRADGLIAYQLAVVVDDAAQGVTEVVRGADLLDSTPRQIYLQKLLGLPTPRYLHLPVAVDRAGCKLSKQTQAPALSLEDPVPALWAALDFLGQQPPARLRQATPASLWDWAHGQWDAARIPRHATRVYAPADS